MDDRRQSVGTILASWTVGVWEALVRATRAAIEEEKRYRPEELICVALVRNGAKNTRRRAVPAFGRGFFRQGSFWVPPSHACSFVASKIK